jgi:hypothetical protein
MIKALARSRDLTSPRSARSLSARTFIRENSANVSFQPHCDPFDPGKGSKRMDGISREAFRIVFDLIDKVQFSGCDIFFYTQMLRLHFALCKPGLNLFNLLRKIFTPDSQENIRIPIDPLLDPFKKEQAGK